MKEIILTKRKNGMLVLLGTIALCLLSIAGLFTAHSFSMTASRPSSLLSVL